MCNLYRMTKGTAEIAGLFGVRAGEGANFAAEVYPGYPGLVVAAGEARVMVDGCPQMADVNDRMPVLLAAEDWSQWVNGTPAEAFALCQTYSSELEVERTLERWAARRS